MDGKMKFRAFYTHEMLELTLDEIREQLADIETDFVLSQNPTMKDIEKAYKVLFEEMSDPWEITANGDCTVEWVQDPPPMKFEIPGAEVKKFTEWAEQQRAKGGRNRDATGFRFTFTFSPCSLGMGITAKDHMTGEELDLSDI